MKKVLTSETVIFVTHEKRSDEAYLSDTIGIGFDIDPQTWKNVTHREIIVG